MFREAIILAGGFGTRLKDVVADLPKPMAPINNKPFLEYVIHHLYSEGFSKIILSLGYKSETVISYFGYQYKSVELGYVVENEPLGTGGAVCFALEKTITEDIAVVNGDTFFPIDFDSFYQAHIGNQNETTLALRKIENSERYGTVILSSENRIRSFDEKGKTGEGLINAGVYLINKSKFQARKYSGNFSFEKDYLEQVVNEAVLSGLVFDTYFIDIGIPESYQQAQTDFRKFSL